MDVAGRWRLDRYPAISIRRFILSPDTCLKEILVSKPFDSNNLGGSLTSSDGTRGHNTQCHSFACHLHHWCMLAQLLGCTNLSCTNLLRVSRKAELNSWHNESPFPKLLCWALPSAEKAGSWVEFWLTVLVCTHSSFSEIVHCQSAVSWVLNFHLTFVFNGSSLTLWSFKWSSNQM